jgi:hypothetical protein
MAYSSTGSSICADWTDQQGRDIVLKRKMAIPVGKRNPTVQLQSKTI